MAFKAPEIREMPDLACIGVVKSIGNVRKSQTSENQVLDIELKAQYAGKDGKFFFVFRPEFFSPDYDPNAETDESRLGMYQRHISHPKYNSTLKNLANSVEANGFEKLGAQFDALHDIDPRGVEQVLKEYVTGAEVGYILTQRKDDDGSLTEQYQVDRFFVPDEEGITAIVKSSKSGRRKRPLVLAFE